MDEMYGLHPTSDEALMWPENLMISEEYNQYHYHSSIHSDADHHHRIPMFGSDELGFQSSVASHESPSADFQNQRDSGDDDEEDSTVIKAKISSHPCYPKLIDAYIDCQKVGAPPEVVCLLDGIRREKSSRKQDGLSTCLGLDPQLDEFMETYCDILVKYKSDLSRPFDEATTFLSEVETQLLSLNNDEVAVSSDRQLKEKLLRLYGSHISNLRLEFSKKKKKGKLPKEARQTLFTWWNSHSKWPYPTEADKVELAESTGLDQKQINNWFINQRKRHWKSPENMHWDAANYGPKE